ncbi:MAG: TPM domain-containing protein, partial [Deltaproteobacteria bacterium]|nr:TPM domain-containing protein [Deltaproteobacteria bacterium]
MSSRVVFLTLFSFLLLAGANRLEARDIPALRGPVMDEAGLLSGLTAKKLEDALVALHQKSDLQLQLYSIPSLEGEVIEEYSIRIVEKWKLGSKERGNGVLLLIAFEDRQARIEVGEGLEGELTDAEAARIIDHLLVPEFRQGRYESGILQSLNAIAAKFGGELTLYGEKIVFSQKSGRDLWPIIFFLLLLFVAFILGPFFSAGRFMRGGFGSGWGGGS